MQGTQGLHGIGTFTFLLLVLWLTWPFTSAIVDTPTDTVQNYLFWGSFVLIALVTLILTPFLIMTAENSSSSIFSALISLGIWCGMLLINLILFPVFTALVGIFSNIQAGNASAVLVSTLQDGTFIIQLFSLVYLAIAVITLYVVPALAAVRPELFTNVFKRFFS